MDSPDLVSLVYPPKAIMKKISKAIESIQRAGPKAEELGVISIESNGRTITLGAFALVFSVEK